MSRRQGFLILSATLLLYAGIGFYPFTTTYWVGRTDLHIDFLVVDALTGRPVPRATLEFAPVDGGGGFCREKEDNAPFTVVTDPAGRAVLDRTQCMCFGAEHWPRESSYAVHLPPLQFRAIAPGFAESEVVDLASTYHKAVRRGTQGKPAGLTAKIALKRQPTG